MKLKKCKDCNVYTLKDKCPICKKQISNAHYKYLEPIAVTVKSK